MDQEGRVNFVRQVGTPRTVAYRHSYRLAQLLPQLFQLRGDSAGSYTLLSTVPLPEAMRDAVEAIGHEVYLGIGNHGFLGVVPYEPDAIAVPRLAA